MRAKILLALDAAGASCSAAVWRDGRVAAGRLEFMRRGQSERLVPMVNEVMRESGVAFADLDAVAVTRGPGGFTGVRIGLATARALALAWKLPLIGATCFETVASAVPPEERRGRTLTVVLDAKRSDVYLQAFAGSEGVTAVAPPQALQPAAVDAALPSGPLVLAGDGAYQVLDALRDAGRQVHLGCCAGAIDAAWLATHAAGLQLPAAGLAVQPLYLREPDVTLPPDDGA